MKVKKILLKIFKSLNESFVLHSFRENDLT